MLVKSGESDVADSDYAQDGEEELMGGKGTLPERRLSRGTADVSRTISGGSDFDLPTLAEQADGAGAEETNAMMAVNDSNTEGTSRHDDAEESDLNHPSDDFVENDPHHDETSVQVSDISGSSHSKEDSPGLPDMGWMESNAYEGRQSFTVSDHGSMRSHRENVDRLLMGAGSSIGGSDLGEARSCMDMNVNETFAHTYDQNYYRSGDWLRFVPRRSTDLHSSQSSSDFPPQVDPTMQHQFFQQAPPVEYPPHSQVSHFNPDRYRGFDNTAIRRYPRREYNNTTRRINTPYGVQSEHVITNVFGPNGTLEMRPNSIAGPIDEEAVLVEERESSTGGGAVFHPPFPIEISTTPTPPPPEDTPPTERHDSPRVIDDPCLQIDEIDPQVATESPAYFSSSLRAGEITRPSSTSPPPEQEGDYTSPNPTSREDQMHLAAWDSKFETYACRVDQSQEDSSVEIAIFSMARPHMRAFHYAWLTFFFAFLAWFSLTPLLSEIQTSLDLSKEEIWTSSICSVAGAVVTRCFAGLFCDMYGARLISAAVLVICGIPTIFLGLVNTAAGLSALRLINGIGGSAFVTCQYWTSTMFTREVAGTANALAAGWGNLGGGISQLFVGTMLFPLLKLIYSSAGTKQDPATLAWRTACIIPGLLCAGFAYFVVKYSDDCPKGNYHKRKKLGLMRKQSAWKHLKSALSDHNTWLLVLMYGCCFGVELTTTNAAALYFQEEFKLSTEAAAAVAFTFGGMNLFARGLGGFLSDVSNAYWGMRGRLIWQLVCFALEGSLIMVFSRAKSLAGSITALMAFSVFVQGAEGSTFGIVPYLNPGLTGTVAGIIGAGGNAGAVIFSIVFQQLPYRDAFFWMGASTTCMSILSTLIWIKGYEGLFFRRRVLPSLTKPISQSTTTHKATEVSKTTGSEIITTP